MLHFTRFEFITNTKKKKNHSRCYESQRAERERERKRVDYRDVNVIVSVMHNERTVQRNLYHIVEFTHIYRIYTVDICDVCINICIQRSAIACYACGEHRGIIASSCTKYGSSMDDDDYTYSLISGSLAGLVDCRKPVFGRVFASQLAIVESTHLPSCDF